MVVKTLNDKIWKDILKKSENKQRSLLEWQLQAREPIYKFSDIKVGDHLVQKVSRGEKTWYYHHFLCTGVDNEGHPTIIHYSSASANKSKQSFCFGSGPSAGLIRKIQEVTITVNEDKLQEKGAEVERVVWPDELKRYPVEEVIRRARKRKDEKDYHLAKNNCESFVMWCLCDLNISLQSPLLVLSLTEIFSCPLHILRQALEQLPKFVTEIIEWMLGRTAFRNAITNFAKTRISGLGSILGVIFTAVVEIVYVGYAIYKAKEKWDEGVLINSRKGFIKEVINAILLALPRGGAAIGGMFIGQIIIPLPLLGGVFGGLIGGIVGMLVGHYGGTGIAHNCSSHVASYLDQRLEEMEPLWTKFKSRQEEEIENH